MSRKRRRICERDSGVRREERGGGDERGDRRSRNEEEDKEGSIRGEDLGEE